MLVLPEMSTMRPGAAAEDPRPGVGRRDDLGPPPSCSPSLQHYPDCDGEVRTLAAEMWGEETEAVLVSRWATGSEGRCDLGEESRESLTPFRTPDFSSTAPLLYTHRTTGDAEIYFVTNQRPQEVVTTAAFRVRAWVPELWWPESGQSRTRGRV